MSTEEKYNGWTNRETWAVALHINNDQGWQESVNESLRELVRESLDPETDETLKADAGEIIRESVENVVGAENITETARECGADGVDRLLSIREDLGSLWRVNWQELGSSFLSDMEEVDSDS